MGKVGARLIRGTVSDIAGAAVRSLVSGSDFGDAVLAGLPDVIGQTVGEYVAGRLGASAAGAIASSDSTPAGMTRLPDGSLISNVLLNGDPDNPFFSLDLSGSSSSRSDPDPANDIVVIAKRGPLTADDDASYAVQAAADEAANQRYAADHLSKKPIAPATEVGITYSQVIQDARLAALNQQHLQLGDKYDYGSRYAALAANQQIIDHANAVADGVLGSGLVDHSQKMTVAARATAEKKTVGQRS